MHGWKDAIGRLPLHAAFGAVVALPIAFGGWSGLAVFIAWRAYDEYKDWREGDDSLAKALIDFASQVWIPAVMASVKLMD